MSSSEIQRGSPYQGLIPYSEADSPFFFGREKETRLIIANLFASPLTLLYGSSGVGKSSVLRAGVEHQLRQREDLLVVVFNSWQSDPINDLKKKIAETASAISQSIIMPAADASLAECLAAYSLQLDRRVMIILDQFEEYFLYHPQEDDFAAEFVRAVTQSNTALSFLISIREDFYAKLDRFEGRIPTLYDNYLRIEHLDRHAARVAIEKPIEQYNHLYAIAGTEFRIEPELVTTVLRQVETGRVILGEAGRGMIETAPAHDDREAQIETPFLQLVLTRLWDEESAARSRTLRLQTLNNLGGAENIVRRHLDAVMTTLLPREQEIAASIFHYLVTPSGTKIAYTASDLAGSAELNESELIRVLEKLSHGDVRILRPVDPPLDRPTAPRYEIFHDVLAPAILAWRAAFVQEQDRSDAERRAEEQRRRADEQARVASRLRRLVAALVVVIVLALGAVALAVAQTARAKAYARQAHDFAELSKGLREEGLKAETAAKSESQRAENLKHRGDAALLSATEAREKTVEQIKIAEQRKKEADRASLNATAAEATAMKATKAAKEQATEARVAFSNLLAVQSKVLVDTFPQGGLLLALEALNTTTADDPPVPAAEQALREVLSRTGGRAMGGHDGPVDDVAVSPNNRWMISTSGSNARLWDLTVKDSTSVPLILEGAGIPVAFSADNRWVATGSGKPDDASTKSGEDGSIIRLYDLTAAHPSDKPRILHVDSKSISRITISPNSRWLVTNSGRNSENTILWSLIQPDRKPIELPSAVAAHATPISPDGHWLITSSWDDATDIATADLWDLTAENPAAKHDQLKGHTMPITNVTFSRDRHWVATSSGEINTHTFRKDTTIRVWDLTANAPGTKFKVLRGHEGPISALAISLDSRWLVSGGGGDWAGRGSDKTVRVWDLTGDDTSAKYVLPDHDGPIFAVTISPNDRWVVTFAGGWRGSTLGDATMRLWDLNSEKLSPIVFREERLPLSLHDIVVSADSHWLVTRRADNTARVWDLSASDPSVKPRILRGHEGLITSVAFSPDDHWVVTGSADKSARLWGLTAEESVGSPIVLQSEQDTDFAISNDHHWLVTIGGPEAFDRKDTVAQLWDLTTQDPANKPVVLQGHESVIFGIAFSPDNHWLATGSDDKTARLWNLTVADPASRPIVLRGHENVVDTVAFTPDKRWLVTGSFDGTAALWRMTPSGVEPKPAFVLKGTQSQVIFDLSISPDSHWLVTTGDDQTLTRLWDLTATNPEANSTVLTGAERGLAISPDSHWLVAPGKTGMPTRLWNLISRESRELAGGGNKIAFSHDHHRLVTAGTDARLWDLNAADPTATPLILRGSQDKSIQNVGFSPDDHWLVTGNEDGSVRVWNVKDPEASPLILTGHTSGVDRLAFSSDSHWLATGSFYDSAVRLWDLTSNKMADTPQIFPINGKTSDIKFSNESTGSHWLMTGNYEDHTVMLWNLRLNELRDLACRTAGRNLTEDEWRRYFPGQKYRSTCGLPVAR